MFCITYRLFIFLKKIFPLTIKKKKDDYNMSSYIQNLIVCNSLHIKKKKFIKEKKNCLSMWRNVQFPSPFSIPYISLPLYTFYILGIRYTFFVVKGIKAEVDWGDVNVYNTITLYTLTKKEGRKKKQQPEETFIIYNMRIKRHHSAASRDNI